MSRRRFDITVIGPLIVIGILLLFFIGLVIYDYAVVRK